VEPKYLTDSALEFPDVAMESVRKETLHLYDNAMEILAHGINLHRHEIFSDMELEGIVNQRRKMFDINIDDAYERNVKVLYGAIVSFTSEAQSHITPELAEDLYALRTAGRHIVESIKDVKHMRKNLEIYSVSDNEYIRHEYNLLRLQLGKVLRELAVLREDSDDLENMILLDLDGLKAEVKNSDVLANGKLDQLIRDNLVTEKMATSLMNDNAYTYEVSMKLIEMGGILFAARAMDLKQAEKSIILNDEELDGIVEEVEAERTEESYGTTKVKKLKLA